MCHTQQRLCSDVTTAGLFFTLISHHSHPGLPHAKSGVFQNRDMTITKLTPVSLKSCLSDLAGHMLASWWAPESHPAAPRAVTPPAGIVTSHGPHAFLTLIYQGLF